MQTRESLNLLYDLRDAQRHLRSDVLRSLETRGMQQKIAPSSSKMTDLSVEFFYTCWKYKLAVLARENERLHEVLARVPLYYYCLDVSSLPTVSSIR